MSYAGARFVWLVVAAAKPPTTAPVVRVTAASARVLTAPDTERKSPPRNRRPLPSAGTLRDRTRSAGAAPKMVSTAPVAASILATNGWGDVDAPVLTELKFPAA